VPGKPERNYLIQSKTKELREMGFEAQSMSAAPQARRVSSEGETPAMQPQDLVFHEEGYPRPRMILTAAESGTPGKEAGADAALQRKLVEAAPQGESIMGDPKAPIKIVEYGSFTCSHCADFDTKTLPRLKSEYIDTGKVQFAFRDYPRDDFDLKEAALAGHLKGDAYFNFVDALMKNQDALLKDEMANHNGAKLRELAKQAGISEDTINTVFQSVDNVLKTKDITQAKDPLVTQLLKQGQTASEELGVSGTPTFFINGMKVVGAIGFDALKKGLDAELK
jgi:protein-disulfide isomerase